MAEKNDWLKKSLQDKFESEKAPVSDELWGMIEPRIPKPNKKRRFIWIWFLFGVLGLTALGLFAWNELKVEDKVNAEVEVTNMLQEEGEKKEEQSDLDNTELNIEDVAIADENDQSKELIVSDKKSMTSMTGRNKSGNGALFNSIAENKIPVNSIESLTNNANSTFSNNLEQVKKKKGEISLLENSPNENAGGSGNVLSESLELIGMSLLLQKQDNLLFERLFEFPFRRMRLPKKKVLPEKGKWSVGLSYARHRQLIYPNKSDRILIEASAENNELQPNQWGVGLHFGRTFKISNSFNWFAEAALGINVLEHAYNHKLLLGDTFVRSVEDQLLKLGISSESFPSGRSFLIIYPGLTLGLNYQPLKQLPIIISAGVYGQYNFTTVTEMKEAHPEYGGMFELNWDVDKKKKIQLGLRSEFQFNKSDWLLFEGRRQSARILLKYNF